MPDTPSKWLSNWLRSGLAAVLALAAGGVLLVVNAQLTLMSVEDACVLALLVYLVGYLVVTVWAFGAATGAQIKNWAERDSRGSWLQRYIFGTAPGPGATMFISAVALFVAVLWLPQRDAPALQGHSRVLVAVSMVAVAWLCVLVSFAVTFHADNIVENGKGFDFPDDDDPSWSDYLYFAIGVMATFGATDVTVTSKAMRKTVSFNAIVAFVFNTVTVATVVSAVGV